MTTLVTVNLLANLIIVLRFYTAQLLDGTIRIMRLRTLTTITLLLRRCVITRLWATLSWFA